MKKFAKIFSAFLALTMVFAICVMPASAVAPRDDGVPQTVEVEVKATQDGQTSSGEKIYKVEVFADSSHSLIAVQCNITYDSSAFQILRATNKADATVVNANMVIDKKDTEALFYQGDIYQEYSGMFESEDLNQDYGYAMFPDDGTAPTLAKITNTNMGETLTAKGYTGIYWQWMVDTTDNYLMISGGKGASHIERPMSGKVKLFTFYVREKADATPGTYTLGFNTEQYRLFTGTYATLDQPDSKSAGSDIASLRPEMITYHNAEIQVGSAGPKVEREKGQIKMTPTSADTVADDFQFRVLSKISDADWKAYLSNTGSSEENNCVTKLGFVAYKGTEDFDMDQAKAAAKAGETQGNYYVATTNYIKHADGTDAEFAARIDTTKDTCDDATYIAFVQYKDADGTEQYAFYDAEYTALIKTHYDSLVSQSLAANPYKG